MTVFAKPNTTLGVGTAQLRDDFLINFGSGSITTATGINTDVGWIAVQIVGGTQTVSSSSDASFLNPGQLKMTTSGVSGQGLALFQGNAAGGSGVFGALGSNAGWQMDVIMKLSATTSICTRFGASTSGGAASDAPNAGIYFEYDTANVGNSDTKFTGITRNASTNTYTTSHQVAADTSFHHFRIRSTTAGTIGFTTDGGIEDTTSSNISTAAMTPFFQIITRSITPIFATLDYYQYVATTGRT